MTYPNAIISLLVLLLVGVVWMFATAGDKRIVNGKTFGLVMKTVATATIFGAAALLYKRPLDLVNATGLLVLLLILFSLFAWWYWHKQHLLEVDESALVQWEFPQAFTIWALATLVITGALWAKQGRYSTDAGGDAGAMLVVGMASLVILLPPLTVFGWKKWNRIPIVIKYREPWRLPVNQDAPVIEPSADALRIFFEVPLTEESEESVSFDVRVPRRVALGEIMHHLLYQHNVQERAHRKIVIAYENKADYLYGWLLYRNGKRWWWTYREYLDMGSPIAQSDLINGERIYAERVRIWENKTKTL